MVTYVLSQTLTVRLLFELRAYRKDHRMNTTAVIIKAVHILLTKSELYMPINFKYPLISDKSLSKYSRLKIYRFFFIGDSKIKTQ